jgi:chromo domain-containing protein 1
VHPDFHSFCELNGFGQLLRKQIRVWCIGSQERVDYDFYTNPSPEMHHNCIELFPIGGIIYITEDVFEETPHLALQIMKLFISKVEKVRTTEGGKDSELLDLYWRLGVRPELMDYLFRKCEEQAKEFDAGEPAAQARGQLYELLSDTDFIAQDCPDQPMDAKWDRFPIMSEPRVFAECDPIEYWDTLARSRDEANSRMVQHYANIHLEQRRIYRYYYVVHTDRLAVQAEQWQKEIQTITDVITPQQCIDELSREGGDKGQQKLFDFYEEG